MSQTKYTYSISSDTVNSKMSVDSLQNQIQQSAIIVAIDYISSLGDVLDIYFKAALSAGDKTILDSVVLDHDGVPSALNPSQVEVLNQVSIDKGTKSFDTIISHNYCDDASWPATDNSSWVVKPADTTKILEISKAEIQFTHDIKFKSATTPKEFYYDVWVFNPLFDSGLSVDADDPTFVPGVSSGNPLRFLYKRYIYESLMDVFNFGNSHFSTPMAIDGLASGVTTVQFDYDQLIVLHGIQGAEIRFSIEDDTQMQSGVGESFFTISMVIREIDV